MDQDRGIRFSHNRRTCPQFTTGYECGLWRLLTKAGGQLAGGSVLGDFLA